jgi:hypothetical protein
LKNTSLLTEEYQLRFLRLRFLSSAWKFFIGQVEYYSKLDSHLSAGPEGPLVENVVAPECIFGVCSCEPGYTFDGSNCVREQKGKRRQKTAR